jgi:hypothetical protein
MRILNFFTVGAGMRIFCRRPLPKAIWNAVVSNYPYRACSLEHVAVTFSLEVDHKFSIHCMNHRYDILC